MERYIGMDVRAASCTLTVISEKGRKLRDFPVEANGQALVERYPHDSRTQASGFGGRASECLVGRSCRRAGTGTTLSRKTRGRHQSSGCRGRPLLGGALTQIDRPDLLKTNPLVESGLVRDIHPHAAPEEAARLLGELIRHECKIFKRSARDEVYYSILERTYFGQPTKQQTAAADLALSYASYRGHHAVALSRLDDRLWGILNPDGR